MPEQDTKTALYERLGGKDGIQDVVNSFYDKILADESIKHFFDQTDMDKQIRHQTLFLTWAVGGPNQYTGRSMTKAHEGMNIQDEHFEAVATHLTTTLEEFGVDQSDVDAVATKVTSMKDDIVRK